MSTLALTEGKQLLPFISVSNEETIKTSYTFSLPEQYTFSDALAFKGRPFSIVPNWKYHKAARAYRLHKGVDLHRYAF